MKNTLLFTLGSMSSKLIMFLFLPLYTYYLTTEQYATIDLITVINKLIVPILSCSIYEAVLRFALDKNEDKTKVFTIGIGFMAIGCILSIMILPCLDFVESLGDYKVYFYLLYVTTALNSLFSVFARSIDKVKLIAINSIISTAIIAVLNILLIAVFHMQIDGYFISLITGNLIVNLLYFWKGRMYHYVNFKKLDSKLLKRMLIYSIPLIPNSLFWWINSSLDRFFLTAMTSLSVVGLYSAASKLPAVLNTLNGIFQQAWGISAIKEYDSEGGAKFFTQMYSLYSLFIILCSSIIILSCKYLGIFLFHNDFYEAWTIVPVLTVGFFYSCLNSFLGTIYTATKSTKSLLITTCVGAMINILFNMLLIPRYGAIGASIGTCISHFSVWIVRLVKGNKILKINVNYKKMIISHLCLVAIAILITCNQIYFELISLGLFTYLILSNKEDLIKIMKKMTMLVKRKKEDNGERVH